ncbi:hypothetical protein SynBIOSE41_02312 [Synechococcus sp. BIOS-E4-1]|nr:hypothetical protein SynBIOSE41_02312 [Synechococcus sp. BIOS-E4-1]
MIQIKGQAFLLMMCYRSEATRVQFDDSPPSEIRPTLVLVVDGPVQVSMTAGPDSLLTQPCASATNLLLQKSVVLSQP